jgi:putative glutamine amidotransferase
MRVKGFLSLVFLLLSLPQLCNAQFHTLTLNQSDSLPKGHLVLLIHPTVYQIKQYTFLQASGYFPDSICFVGVYSKQEAYNYSESHAYVQTDNLSFWFYAVDGKIDKKSVFGINPCTAEFEWLFSISDGAIFNGGPDIQPSVYGNETSLLTAITDPGRHFFEISFLSHLLRGSTSEKYSPLLEKKPDYPLLAICLGLQTMNVACGGTLTQDIPTEIYQVQTVEEVLLQDFDTQHRNYLVNLDPMADSMTGGRLHHIIYIAENPFGAKKHYPYLTYSYHHQAIGKTGDQLIISATSTDQKVPESIRHLKYRNVAGIQFHPEFTPLYDPEKKQYQTYDGKTIGSAFLEEASGMEINKLIWDWFSREVTKAR